MCPCSMARAGRDLEDHPVEEDRRLVSQTAATERWRVDAAMGHFLGRALVAVAGGNYGVSVQLHGCQQIGTFLLRDFCALPEKWR